METKTCPGCGAMKLAKDFSKCSRNKSGLQVYCKDCMKKWRDSHREHVAVYLKAWRARKKSQNNI